MDDDTPRGPAPSAWGNAQGLLARLEGRWRLARRITGDIRMAGEAVFTRQPDGWLHYRETGRLVLPDGKSFDGSREYRFAPAADGFAVHFAEDPPRLFHAVVLAPHDGGLASGEILHLCGDDRYTSAYAFEADGRFSIAHTVSGPRKDYRSHTVFDRVDTPRAG